MAFGMSRLQADIDETSYVEVEVAPRLVRV